MLHEIQRAVQFANPFIIDALTKVHGVYCNVYNKDEPNEYDEGRDSYISNPDKYSSEPFLKKTKLLLYEPVQETYEAGEESFDSYMNDTYILTVDKSLVFNKGQKYEIFYNKNIGKNPDRVMQCFKVIQLSNSYNQWSIKKVMLKPFN